jgi:hypothetical protein
VHSDGLAVGDSNAGTLLASMLQGQEAKEGNPGYVLARDMDSKDPTRLMHFSVPISPIDQPNRA